MLRVVFFGTSNAITLRPLAAVAGSHRVVGIVQPRPQLPGSRPRRILTRVRRRLGVSPTRLERLARVMGVPCWTAAGRGDPEVAERIRAVSPDVLCVAGYPWILRQEMLDLGRLGAFNVHPSLLPRHRGAMPLQWTYAADDGEAGVSVHWMTSRVDAGAVAGRHAVVLPRGLPVETLDELLAGHGARLLSDTLDALERGAAGRMEQDESAATRAPVIRPGMSLVDFAAWGVERVWHVLAGLATRYREALRDAGGGQLSYQGVRGYRLADHDEAPGTARRAGDRVDLYCLGGVVQLDREAAR